MKSLLTGALSLALLASPPAIAAPGGTDPEKTLTIFSLRDFAHAHVLETSREGAIHRAPLPRFVYEGLTRSRKRDLAVFNSDGEIVPFAARDAEPEETLERTRRSVPFYELPPERSRGDSNVGVYVSTGADGRVISINSGSGGSETRERRYLLDFSQAEARGDADEHTLSLSLPRAANLSASVSVLESANLRDWTPLVKNAPLIQLQNRDGSLTGDSLSLPRAPGRYLLLRVEGTDPFFELRDVVYSAALRRVSARLESAEFDGAKAASNVVEYDTLGAYPVSEVNFLLQAPGFYKVRYLSRPDGESEWRFRGEAELWTISEPGGTRSNPPVPVKPQEDRHWRLESGTAFSVSSAPPKLKIAWKPGEIFFLAQGKAPYILAFGGPAKIPVLQDASFLRGGSSAAEAKIGPAVDLGEMPSPASVSESGAAAETALSAEWQRYFVWGLLLLGGLLLSLMAWKLLKSEKDAVGS